MKSFVWIIGGAAVVSGGVWFYFWYNSPEQRRLRSLGGPGKITGRNQQAVGVAPTIFHEPDLEPISVDLGNIGTAPL